MADYRFRIADPAAKAFLFLSMASDVRTRFAPSPTGLLHVGGARTALFSWLYARKNEGTFVLRVEDTDQKRNTPQARAAILDGLHWLGLTWDEGPEVGGAFGPYYQSERNAVYETHFEALKAKGVLYEDQGAWRFRSPRQPIVVDDLVCGRIAFDRTMDPDMTIRRPDGSWIFHFVNVVDDAEMKISHVIRGEDHLSNTPKHIELYQALGFTPPRFAHIPLILNRDGSKMSKRDEGAAVSAYIEQGYAPEAVFNYLCLLGWSPKDDREYLERDEIRELFSLEGINRRNAKFDLDKCFWLNGQHILKMSIERFTELAIPFLDQAGISYGDPGALPPILAIVKEKVKHFTDVPDWIGYFFTEEYPYDEAAVTKALRKEDALAHLNALAEAYRGLSEWSAENLETSLKATAEALGCKTGALIHPARVAVSGRAVGPSLYHMLELLGQERVVARFRRTIERFQPSVA